MKIAPFELFAPAVSTVTGGGAVGAAAALEAPTVPIAWTASTASEPISGRRHRVRASRRIVLIIPHPGAANHNGGQLQFAPDGLLYMSVGDGGSLLPRGEPARDLEDLRGKILRIRPLPSGGKAYGIPISNPYVGKPGRDEIYAYGLRNPWRFSFDDRRVAIADVGQEAG